MKKTNLTFIFILSVLYLSPNPLLSQYKQPVQRAPEKGEIPVSEPGSYDKIGSTYILVNNITSPKSAIFLGKDVTLDLNGYTVSYAAGDYQHIPNYSFEEGLTGWDISGAATARIEDTKVHVFVGENILRLSAGEEIVSPFINLPVAERSYFAMCGVTKREMQVSVYVEDADGNQVKCTTSDSDSTKVSCPMEKRSPRLGGGFIYAHLNGIMAGRYRIRVKAETDCLIDHIDIRPAMDVGIGIVEKTHPMGHNDHLYERAHSAFFDYTEDVSLGKPVPGIPVIKGKGTVTIKNGIIRNGTTGVLSWGIQSTAADVCIILDNVKIVTSGINTSAVDVPQATITDCYFDVKSPFIINRHGAEFYAVDLIGEKPSEVSYSEFFGGQGCLVFKGNYSKIHHNFFANRQTVTNHYSIMAMGDSSQIFENKIIPEIGSGIEIYVHRGMEIFNNEIHVVAAPPTCEYGHEDYSTTAIRIADYGAKPGSAGGCFGNKIYNNRFYITGKDYPEYTDYVPMAWAVFYSASAGENFIFGNQIVVNDQNLGSKNETAAFYIGGGAIGGHFFDNHIITNAPAAWVASRYGAATEAKICNNTIVKSSTANDNFKPFRMGWDGYHKCVARDIQFRSNVIEGAGFEIDATGQDHSYTVYWPLEIHVTDKNGKALAGKEIRILDNNGEEVFKQLTGQEGPIISELPEYSLISAEKVFSSPYTVIVGKKKQKVELSSNSMITIVSR
ncbi:MAG: hypothetical protein KAT31_09175 [Bacteroidales bacterium]|nr:hypothetical protein [Bacteroidales bacterium]